MYVCYANATGPNPRNKLHSDTIICFSDATRGISQVAPYAGKLRVFKFFQSKYRFRFWLSHYLYYTYLYPMGWLGSRVVSVLDSGTVGPAFKSQPRSCRVTVLGKLFTPIVPQFTKQQNW